MSSWTTQSAISLSSLLERISLTSLLEGFPLKYSVMALPHSILSVFCPLHSHFIGYQSVCGLKIVMCNCFYDCIIVVIWGKLCAPLQWRRHLEGRRSLLRKLMSLYKSRTWILKVAQFSQTLLKICVCSRILKSIGEYVAKLDNELRDNDWHNDVMASVGCQERFAFDNANIHQSELLGRLSGHFKLQVHNWGPQPL